MIDNKLQLIDSKHSLITAKAKKFFERVEKFFETKGDFLSYENVMIIAGWPAFQVNVGISKPIYGYKTEVLQLSNSNQHEVLIYLNDRYDLWQAFGPDEFKFKSYIYELVIASASCPEADVTVEVDESRSVVYQDCNSYDTDKICISDRPTTYLVEEYSINLYAAIDKVNREKELEKKAEERLANLLAKLNKHFSLEEQEELSSHFIKSDTGKCNSRYYG